MVALCVADFYDFGGLVSSVSAGNFFGNFLLAGDAYVGKFLFRAGNSGTYCQTTGVSHLDHAFVAGTWDKSTLRAYSAVNGGGLTAGTTAAQTTGFVGAAPENYVGYYSRDGGRSYLQPIYAVLVFDRALSVDEIDALRRDLYALYRPANQSPFLISIPGGGGVTISPANCSHGHAAESPSLVQANVLAPAGAEHAHSAEQPTLSTATTLSPEETVHGHSAESPALSAAGTLEPADAVHAHSAESPTIVQAHVLVVLESTHAHTADNVTLTLGGSLDVADALHGHVVDQPTLTQANAIAPADSAHGHSVESPALTQANSLSPANATHGHAADQPTLDLSVYLSPSEATHAHAADAPSLTQDHILAVDEALHAHYADSPLLPQDYTIVVSDTLHAHLTASPNLILGTLPLMSGRVYLSRATLRVYRPTKRLNS